MTALDNKRFPIVEALRDVKVATIAHLLRCDSESINNLAVRELVLDIFGTFDSRRLVSQVDFLLESAHNLFYDVCLQDIRDVDPFRKLCHQGWFAHALGASDEDDKRLSGAIELAH